jgi:hypothetical protein
LNPKKSDAKNNSKIANAKINTKKKNTPKSLNEFGENDAI